MKGKLLVFAMAVSLGMAQPGQPTGEVHILHVRGPIYMLVGAGGNITVSVGQDGVLLVDTGLANRSDQVLAAVRQLQRQVATNEVPDLHYGAENLSTARVILDTDAPPKPIRYIINTHMH